MCVAYGGVGRQYQLICVPVCDAHLRSLSLVQYKHCTTARSHTILIAGLKPWHTIRVCVHVQAQRQSTGRRAILQAVPQRKRVPRVVPVFVLHAARGEHP